VVTSYNFKGLITFLPLLILHTIICHELAECFERCDSNGSLFLRQNHDFWHQVQGQLYITGCQYCDLVVWTTVNMSIIRVEKVPEWSANISKLIDFYFETFIRPYVVCSNGVAAVA